LRFQLASIVRSLSLYSPAPNLISKHPAFPEMCLPFLCGGREHDQGPGAHQHHDTQHQRQPATPPRPTFPDRADGGYQYEPPPVNGAGHGYAAAGQNFGAGDAYARGRAPGGNGEAGAAFYYSDTDARGRRQGAAPAPAPHTPERKEAVVPTPISAGAPGKRGVANTRVPQPHVTPGG
jgi:hypothetical protein